MYRVVEYTEEFEKEWDEFVLKKSMNGTFLQTRNFLNYHPKSKFEDASIMIYQNGRLIALCPACIIYDEGKKILFSHKGSTFGGIIIKEDYYTAEKVLEIIRTIDEFCEHQYDRIVLKNTSDLFAIESGDLLEYLLGYCGYENYIELSTYVDLQNTSEDILSDFDRNKKRNILKCEEKGLLFRELENDEEIRKFHQLLTINLSKYGVKPVHKAEELIEFRNYRIPDNVKFYGVFDGKKMMAAGMLFVFEKTGTIHAQNLSADYRFTEFSPITYLYYKVIESAKKQGFKKLSWGISTENAGKELNMGLIRNKESYGSKHDLNRTFIKNYVRKESDAENI